MMDLKSVLSSAPSGWHLDILYKSVRHIYFRIYPVQKQVRITAPRSIQSLDLDGAIQAKFPNGCSRKSRLPGLFPGSVVNWRMTGAASSEAGFIP